MTLPCPACWKVTFTHSCSSIQHSLLLAASGFPHLEQNQIRRDLWDPTFSRQCQPHHSQSLVSRRIFPEFCCQKLSASRSAPVRSPQRSPGS